MSDLNQWLRYVRDAMKTQNHAAAAEGLRQVIAISRRDGDRAAEGRYLGNLAAVYKKMGKSDQALRSFYDALTIARGEGDRMTEQGLLGTMATILHELKHYDYAISYLHHAIAIAQELNDQRGQGNWIYNLANVYADTQQADKAIELYGHAVNIARDMRDQKGLSARLDSLASAHLSQGDYPSGLIALNEAAHVYQEMGQWQTVMERQVTLGDLYCEMAKYAPERIDQQVFYGVAIQYYQQAYVTAQGQDDHQHAAELLLLTGQIFLQLGNHEQAIYRLLPAAEQFQQLEERERAAEAQRMLAAAQNERGRTHIRS